jgi:hypothetical protein
VVAIALAVREESGGLQPVDAPPDDGRAVVLLLYTARGRGIRSSSDSDARGWVSESMRAVGSARWKRADPALDLRAVFRVGEDDRNHLPAAPRFSDPPVN